LNNKKVLGNDDSIDTSKIASREGGDQPVYESMQALLMQESSEFQKRFQESLWSKLNSLAGSDDDDP